MRSKIRKFNGKEYRLHSYEHRKSDASAFSRAYCSRGNRKCRIVKDSTGPGYYIYVRG